jgi:hypothetical protein
MGWGDLDRAGKCAELTLNQRVLGSSPSAPTIVFAALLSISRQNIQEQLGGQLGESVPLSSFRMALSPSAGSRAR